MDHHDEHTRSDPFTTVDDCSADVPYDPDATVPLGIDEPETADAAPRSAPSSKPLVGAAVAGLAVLVALAGIVVASASDEDPADAGEPVATSPAPTAAAAEVPGTAPAGVPSTPAPDGAAPPATTEPESPEPSFPPPPAFETSEGVDLGSTGTSALLVITNTGTSTLDWSVQADVGDPLTLSTSGGSLPPGVEAGVTVTVDRDALEPGAFSFAVRFSAAGEIREVAVSGVEPFVLQPAEEAGPSGRSRP